MPRKCWTVVVDGREHLVDFDLAVDGAQLSPPTLIAGNPKLAAALLVAVLVLIVLTTIAGIFLTVAAAR